MRIIAGKYRHRLIEYPENNKGIRPTKDRIREALFSALGDISGFTVLDLYAGSGAMGIEALSRGAGYCYFVDKDKEAIKVIKNNIHKLQIENCKIIHEEDFNALKEFENNNIIFDLIILDPPYAEGKYEEVISYLLNNNMLKSNAIIVCESNRIINYDAFAFNDIRRYHYGEINIDLIRR